MTYASLDTISGNDRRTALVFVCALGWLILMVVGVLQLPGLAPRFVLGAVVAGFGGMMAILIVGSRTWASTRVRYELDEVGLSTFGPQGELRERLPWGEIREYVLDTFPRTSIRVLYITRADGSRIRITEHPNAEKKVAFARFYDSFLQAAAQRQTITPIRQGVSFYDRPAAFALGIVLLVLLVGLGVASLFIDAGSSGLRLITTGIIVAPFIYRTVFNRTVADAPPRRDGVIRISKR